MMDAATNNISSTNEFSGINIQLASDSNQGGIRQKGVKVTLSGADTNIGSGGASSAAFWSNTEDGGTDFFAQSSADGGDYFAISTTAHGATTFKTLDDDAAAAHLSFNIDGDINFYKSNNTDDYLNLSVGAHGDATFTTIDAAGTAGHLKFIADGDITNNPATGDFYFINGSNSDDYFKINVAGNHGVTTLSTVDAAAAAADFTLDIDGDIILDPAGKNIYHKVSGTTVNDFDLNTGTYKYYFPSQTDDYFEIGLAANGATTLTTVDAAAAAAHFEVAADGNITLDAAGDISLEAGGNDVSIVAGDLTMYDAVNDGNPTISLGSSATNRLEIKTAYNSGAQTIDEVYFSTYTTSSSTNDGRYIFEVDEVELARILDGGLVVTGNVTATDAAAKFQCTNTTASSATEGGQLRLISNDGAAMADNHRLGIITFEGAEDASSNLTVGAQIESFCDAGWSASENGARMVFSTTDGNASTSTVLTLDSDKKATFTGPIACTTRTLAVTSSTDGDANGDVVYFGGTTSMTVGKIYHYKSDGTWELANADAVATADGLLGVALGAASDTNGMLLRGMVTLDHDPGAIGDVLYVQSDNAGTPGNATATAPSASGDCVRIIGYQVSHASNGNIWFNPDNTFVEVA